jgi:ATP-dependent helicase HrpB
MPVRSRQSSKRPAAGAADSHARTHAASRPSALSPQPSSAARERDNLAIGNILVHAFPDRIARQDPGNPRRYQLANGRGARLHENTLLYG